MPAVAARTVLRLLWWCVVGALVALFGCYVWPTAYRYDHMTVDGDVVPVRIHRITGEADMLLPDEGWVPAEGDDGGSTARPDGQHI